MKKNEILAIVVTYNRKEFLKENLEALLKQTFEKFDILVIDNNSSDGTGELLNEFKNKYNNINYIKIPENIGGAGGFNKGMKEAILGKYKYAWLMDDDTIPCENSLNSLINKANFLKNDFSFLASVVKWIDGKWCYMNIPKEKNIFEDSFDYITEKGLIEIESASFVSCFVNIIDMKKYGLPIKEFFIYSDDLEYTRRISKYKKAYLDLNSMVIHKMKENKKDERFSVTDKNRIKRLYFSYRNKFYLAKKEKKVLRYILRYFYHCIKFIFKSPKYKFLKVIETTKGMFAGIFFNPKIEYIYEREKNNE